MIGCLLLSEERACVAVLTPRRPHLRLSNWLPELVHLVTVSTLPRTHGGPGGRFCLVSRGCARLHYSPEWILMLVTYDQTSSRMSLSHSRVIEEWTRTAPSVRPS